MSTAHDNTAFDEVPEPVASSFTLEVARRIASLRANAALEARLDELARKANEGELSEQEREQYRAYVEAIDMVSILQAKAHKMIADSAAS
jgi:hypothetical protein